MIGHIPPQDEEVRRLLEAGRLTEANMLFDRVITRLPNSGGEQWANAGLLLNRGVFAWRLERIPLALELAAEGWVELENATPEGPDAAATFGLLGFLLESIGHRRPALDMFRRALRIARDSGDRMQLCVALQRMGGVLNFRAVESGSDQATGLFTEARALLAEGVAICEPDWRTYGPLICAHSRALLGVGEIDASEEQAKLAIELAGGQEDLWTEAVAYWVLGGIRQVQGKLDQARTMASRAVSGAERVADTNLLMRFSLDLAEICADMDDHVGQAVALRRVHAAGRKITETLQEGLGQALEQRRLAVQAQRLALAAQQAAARDPLTGLVNRLGLERQAPVLLESTAARGRVPWLVLVDVDWFKDVNDNAGHAAGDAALREVAQILRKETRAEDLVCRWAGDEFVVLLTGSGDDRNEAGPVVAERIRAAVAGHHWKLVIGETRQPTVSIGVAAGPADLDQLFAAADLALYRAKRLGRNRVEEYSADFAEPMELPTQPRDVQTRG
ncbi:diguanylate cyclase [Pseudonocardiaceae bacterium YIM PH 21723]|nr:diguanylate cyclase [Pseudonocardiaceae bacterium YIM PH 21723]